MNLPSDLRELPPEQGAGPSRASCVICVFPPQNLGLRATELPRTGGDGPGGGVRAAGQRPPRPLRTLWSGG